MKRVLFASIAAAVLAAPLAFADKPRRGLQKYEEDTTEVKDVNKRPSKVKSWVEAEEDAPIEFQFPWMQVGGRPPTPESKTPIGFSGLRFMASGLAGCVRF
jgi:heat shock protein HslJ